MRFLRSRLFLLLVLLLGLPALWRYVIADWLAERRWQEYAREAKARGLRWTLAEYRHASSASEEDAAQLPVFASPQTYEPVLKQVPVLKKEKPRKDHAPQRIDWLATRKEAARLGLPDDPAEADDLRALDAAARPLQALVDQLCESKATAGNWGDVIWKADVDSPFPHLTLAMQCSSLLRFRSNLDVALGRPAEARRAIKAQLRLARVFSRMPTLIANLVTVSSVSVARETVWRGIDAGVWDDDTLRAFAAQFLAWNAIADFEWSMETERAWSRGADDTLIADPDKTMQMLTFLGTPRSKVDEWLLRLAVSRPAWHRNNQLWYERAQDELATSLDAAAGIWRPIVRQYVADNLTESERQRDLAMAAQSINFTHAFMQKTVWVHAQNQMAAIGCALELARRATGKYPATLEALVPACLPRLPVDPATGTAFRFTLQPDGTYLLYSVGFDREDQGGKLSEESDRDHTDPDWRWWGPSAQSAGQPR